MLARMMVGAAALMAMSACAVIATETVKEVPVPAPPAPVAVVAPSPPPAPAVRERIESVASPTYVSIPMEITINKPAKDVWARIGKYCDISEWLQIAAGCTITSGKDGEVGSVRTIGQEVLVGKTEFSYTYSQTVRDGRPYNLYHGTLEARPINARTSKILYTLMYDNSLVPGDAAAKEAEIARRRTTFENALKNIKILAEGGTLPPRAAPAAPAGAAPAPAPATPPRTPG